MNPMLSRNRIDTFLPRRRSSDRRALANAATMATIVALVLWMATPILAAGRLVEHSVPAPSIEGNLLGIPSERDVAIYLPAGYDEEKDRRYPTLYLLHGIGDSHTTWIQAWSDTHAGYATIQDLMDRGHQSGRVAEMIVVVPDADKTCHYTDSPVKGEWGTFIARDLVGFVDREYRTLPVAASRGIAGHSMGGHGAIKLGMLRPDVFGVVYGLNPSLLGWGADVSKDNPHLRGIADLKGPQDIAEAHFYVRAIIGIGQSFSPNPDSPFLTDLPFEPAGDALVRSQPGFAAWQRQMPLYMLDEHADGLRRLRGLRFDSAFEDEYPHIPITAMAFSQALTERGIEHVFEMYNGNHRNRLWGRQGRLYTELLPWFSELLIATAGAPASTAEAPASAGQAAAPKATSTGKRGRRLSPRKAQATLWNSAISGDLVKVRRALDAGADVNALDTRDNTNGRRALNWAAWHGQVEMIRLLVEAGARIDEPNGSGFTPLHHAAEAGSTAAAEVLLELGADRLALNRFGHSPAETARRHGHERLALLIDTID